MGQATPTQHPAVVLRSHYNHLRALLAVAMIAVAGLIAAVMILATNDETDTSGGSASSPSSLTAQSQPRPTQEQAFPGLARQARGLQPDGPRQAGGPDGGTRGVAPARQPNVDASPGARHDGGPAAQAAAVLHRLDEEGTAAVTSAQPPVIQEQAFPGLAPSPRPAARRAPPGRRPRARHSRPDTVRRPAAVTAATRSQQRDGPRQPEGRSAAQAIQPRTPRREEGAQMLHTWAMDFLRPC
jgi:hypothetical protein